MNDSTVVVTELEYGKARGCFEAARQQGWDCRPAPAGEPELARAVEAQGARYVIVGVERYSGELYEALPEGGVIARFGVGHDGVDKAKATRRGILCVNTPGALNQAVTEQAMALMLAAARHLPQTAAACAAGSWAPALGVELARKRLAIIGCGPIGRAVARCASFGFGMHVTACDIAPLDSESLRRDFGIQRLTPDFEHAAACADFVSLHIPSLPATRHFISAERLAQMKPDSWLVNTARGAVVDERALFDALSDNRLAGAALDVFETEPYEPAAAGKDLRTLPNVIMTPHCGSSTVEACETMARLCLHNLALAREGRYAEMNLLNPEGRR